MKVSSLNINFNKASFRKKDSILPPELEHNPINVQAKLTIENPYTKKHLQNDKIILANCKKQYNPSFRGFWNNLFKKTEKKENIDVKSSELTPEEIEKKKIYVTNRISQILLAERDKTLFDEPDVQSFTELKKLMNSEYLDYQVKTEKNICLNDYLFDCTIGPNTPMYDYFLLESLSKHNDKIDISKKDLPGHCINKLVQTCGAYACGDNEEEIGDGSEFNSSFANKAANGIRYLVSQNYENINSNNRTAILEKTFGINFSHNSKHPFKVHNEFCDEDINFENFSLADLCTCLSCKKDIRLFMPEGYPYKRVINELTQRPNKRPERVGTKEDRFIAFVLDEYFKDSDNRSAENVIDLTKKICFPYKKDHSVYRFYNYIAEPLSRSLGRNNQYETTPFYKKLETLALENGKVCQGDELDEYGIAIVNALHNGPLGFNVTKETLDGPLYSLYKQGLKENKYLGRNELYNLCLKLARNNATTSQADTSSTQQLRDLLNDAMTFYDIKCLDYNKLAQKLIENKNATLIKAMLDEKLIKASDKIEGPYGKCRVDTVCLLSDNKQLKDLFSLTDTIHETFNDVVGENIDSKLITRLLLDPLSNDEFILEINKVISTKDIFPYLFCLRDLICNRLNSSKLKLEENNALLKLSAKLLNNKRIVDDKLIDINNVIVDKILKHTIKHSPEIANLINHSQIDINKKNISNSPSILANAFTNKYVPQVCAQILIESAKKDDFSKVAKELKDQNKEFGLEKGLAVWHLEDLIKDNPEMHKDIANLYKKVGDQGGKLRFYEIAKYPDFVKALKEAGIDMEKSYGDYSLFQSMIQHGITSALNNLSVKRLVEEGLKTDNGFLQEKCLSKAIEITTKEKDFDRLYNSYTKIEDLIKNEKDKFEKAGTKNYCDKALNRLEDSLFSIAAEWKMSPNILRPQIIDLAKKYQNAVTKKEKNELLYKIAIRWKAADNLLNLCTKELIEAILPVGICYFPIPEELVGDVTRRSLEYYINLHPDIADGICTMSEFYYSLQKDPTYNKARGRVLNIDINKNKETLLDIYFNIAKETEEDEKINGKLIDILLKLYPNIDWTHKDINGSNYALKAVQSENVAIVQKLLDDKKFNGWTETNKFGQCALSEGKHSPNPKIKAMFENKKIQSEELLNYAEMGSSVAVKKLLENEYIDINTKNRYNENIWNIAARNNDKELVNLLKDRKDLDFSNIDSFGMNFLMRVIDKCRNGGGEKFFNYVIENLSGKQLGLNEIFVNNGKTYSIYSYVDNIMQASYGSFRDIGASDLLFKIIFHKDANINVCNDKLEPYVFSLIKRGSIYIEKLVDNGKIDPDLTYKGRTLESVIEKANLSSHQRKEYYELLKRAKLMSQTKDIKDFIEKHGILSLQNISEILKYPAIKEIIRNKITDNDETLAHLLLDIPLTEENMLQMMQLTKEMLSVDRNAFRYGQDKLGQTAEQKAILAENDIVFELITKNRTFEQREKKRFLELAKQTNNENLIQLVKNITTLG